MLTLLNAMAKPFATAYLADLLKQTEKAHREFQQRYGSSDSSDWPSFYAEKLIADLSMDAPASPYLHSSHFGLQAPVQLQACADQIATMQLPRWTDKKPQDAGDFIFRLLRTVDSKVGNDEAEIARFEDDGNVNSCQLCDRPFGIDERDV